MVKTNLNLLNHSVLLSILSTESVTSLTSRIAAVLPRGYPANMTRWWANVVDGEPTLPRIGRASRVYCVWFLVGMPH